MIKTYRIEKKFLILGLCLTAVSVSCLIIDYNFLAIFYALPGLFFLFYFFGYKLKTDDDCIEESYFIVKRTKLKWTDVNSISKSRFNSIILMSERSSIRVPNVLPNYPEFLDDVIKRVDKNCISHELINEWSKTFTKFNDDFQGLHLKK